MRFRFRTPADLDFGDEIFRPCNNGDRVTDITFKSNGLLFIIQMFAIMATETARGIDVTKIVRMCRPINFLILEHGTIVYIFESLNSRTDQQTVARIIVSRFIILFKPINSGERFERGTDSWWSKHQLLSDG